MLVLKDFTVSTLTMHLIVSATALQFGNHFSYFHSDLVNVFEVFLPQLLLYPNASDPLNGDAAALMMRDHAAYEQKVKGSNTYQVSML